MTSSPQTIHALFAAAAAAHPGRVALRWQGQALSYAELDERANRLAHHLRGLGAGPESVVGVLLPRNPELIIALLGVLKAGAAYLPLDPAYPAERVEYMLGHTRVGALVSTAALAEGVAGYDGPRVRVDADAQEIAGHSGVAPVDHATAGNLAYVIYTSGSTGRPKGVQIEHRNTRAVLEWLRDAWSEEERAAVLASTSVCFDVSVAEIFGTLCWGGTLVLAGHALALAGLQEPVTTAAMVPSAAAELLRMGAIPACVRTLALGGEPLRNELAQRLLALGHVTRVQNLYGPTEDTTYSTCKEVEPGRERKMSVGRPVSGTQARVLDAALRPLTAGESGEIWMGGAGVSRGYLRDPAMTAERYRPDPLGAAGARMYRTGDLGRWLDDGDLDCLGRSDHQVKVRGYRVEPGEIENALAAHPRVAEAAVTAWDDRGETRLAAWYSAQGEAPTAAELREHLRETLPDYMLPDAFALLPALPHTPNGKLDRLALPQPRLDRSGAGEYLAPRTPDEAALAAIWSQVLGVERVGVRDDFFALGGHSLLATQIVARVREQLRAELPLGTLFAMPTVEELARQLQHAASPSAAELSIPRAPRNAPLPLSFPQEAVWFFQHLKPGMRSYNFQATVRIRGPLQSDVLERALGEIVRRHEIFRTTFPSSDGTPRQQVHAPWEVRLAHESVVGSGDESAEEVLERRLKEEFRRPFDLERLPLLRWTLFELAPADHVLLCVEHHLVHDGWSFGVFLRELTALYDAYVRGEPSPLPEPEVQFADFAAWQHAWLETPEAQEQLAWWKQRLQGAPPVLPLPTDHPRPAEMSFRGGAHRVRLPRELFQQADAFSRRQGVTLFTTLFAAFQALMQRYTGETDFCLGSGVAGRRLRQSEGLIGMVVNTIPIRADLAGDPSFLELLGRVGTATVETWQRQEVPFSAIVGALDPERSRGHLPVFQVAFNFHHAPYPELRLGDATLEVEEGLGNESAKFDLNVVVIPRVHQHAGEEVVMIWEYAEDLFERATVGRMIGHFQAVLAAALQAPQTRVSRLALATAQEEREMLARAGSATPYPREATLHGLFAEQLRARPQAVAVDEAGVRLSYRALAARAGWIARRLARAGVVEGDRVALAMERSADMIAAMLGVVSLGAAYVTLDPEYPAERLRFMLADCGARALVVRGEVPAALRDFAGACVCAGEANDDEAPFAVSAGVGGSAAYQVYTSGSTGTPKGSLITHRGVIRLARDTDYLRLAVGDRVGHGSPPAFDAATWEIWAPLLTGGTVVVLERDELLSPRRLETAIRERQIGVLFLTTVIFNQMARENPGGLASLGVLLTGGEAADAGAFARVREACPGLRLLHLYGPSEVTTYATWHEVGEMEEGAPVPIGGPMANTRAYVLDEAMHSLPEGVPGELYLAGDGLAWGYGGRPALTAERFLPDPHAPQPGGRMYRSGDRVRWRRGALEFVGRADDQVKVRGFRVEPGEVEAALRAHPQVADAAVVVLRDAEGDLYLAAAATRQPGSSPDAAGLRAHLAARLPAWMVPATLRLVDSMPRTPGGKLDRRALATLEAEYGHESPALSAEPETVTQAALAEIWREVLVADRVGPDDNFFDLGGHSLKATRVLSRVSARLGVELPVGAVFDHPTLRGMAALVDERLGTLRMPDEALLEWLEGLSEEEAQRLLAESDVTA